MPFVFAALLPGVFDGALRAVELRGLSASCGASGAAGRRVDCEGGDAGSSFGDVAGGIDWFLDFVLCGGEHFGDDERSGCGFGENRAVRRGLASVPGKSAQAEAPAAQGCA